MKTLEIERNLILNTNFLNLVLELNGKIESYENYGIETPTEIQEILTDLKISANLIFVFSDCIAIARSFNESNMYLYKVFFIKSIFRTIYEAFKIIDKYDSHLFKDSNHIKSVNEIIELRKTFKKKHNFKKMGEIRNKVGSHYPESFIEHHNTIINIDFGLTLQMFYDFLNLVNQISNYLSFERFPINETTETFALYFKDVEEKLKNHS